ncbi:MAG: hypothetical protein ABSC65_29630 [Acidobacteriaceae bacterium]|jgi:hypothetical protein
MPDTKAFDQHYTALSDEELLKLAAEGGFTAEAAQLLRDAGQAKPGAPHLAVSYQPPPESQYARSGRGGSLLAFGFLHAREGK